jgi:hypothetical protein
MQELIQSGGLINYAVREISKENKWKSIKSL